MAAPRLSKYDLYERAVQTPDAHVVQFNSMYREVFGREPRSLREDFCGTFAISSEWVRSHPENSAIGIDLDAEPLAYGRKKNFASLTAGQRKRLKIHRANVLSAPTTPKSDLVIACNFSFFVFKERETLKKYVAKSLRSLNRSGILMLETLGGPGAIETVRERKPVFKKGKRQFTYYWDQKSFDPITHDAQYSIHFGLPDGTKMKDVFTYDWRLWTIPELRDILKEAGFTETCVFWETEHEGEGTGEYTRMEKGDNAYSWIAYVCGIRR